MNDFYNEDTVEITNNNRLIWNNKIYYFKIHVNAFDSWTYVYEPYEVLCKKYWLFGPKIKRKKLKYLFNILINIKDESNSKNYVEKQLRIGFENFQRRNERKSEIQKSEYY